MATIFIETIPIANSFQLNRTLYIGYAASKDWLEEYSFDDRLRAAIYNFGVTCKELIDGDYYSKSIGIISDNDGKDVRYDGEQNVLHSLLHIRHDETTNITYNLLNSGDASGARKLASLYREYNPWLERARHLMDVGHIKVGLIESGGDLIDRFYKGDFVQQMNKKPINHYHSTKLGWIK